jgi:hypothetical protein
MGTLKVKQDDVSIEVEWPGGAMSITEFVEVVDAVGEIHKTLAGPTNSVLLASSCEYSSEPS